MQLDRIVRAWTPEPGECPFAGRGQQWRRHEAGSTAVGVAHPQTSRNLPVDTQRTAMHRAVVHAAQHTNAQHR
jgi:hypothetical protein